MPSTSGESTAATSAAPDVEASTSRRTRIARALAGTMIVAALAFAVWSQRDTVSGAIDEIGRLTAWSLVALAGLTVYERWSRADIVRRLLGEPVGIGTAVVIHDVGTAVSKGVPLGGALGTALRWSIARDRGVTSARFATMLIAYGIATTFVSWILPFAALLADLTQRSPDVVDLAMLGGIAAVVVASAAFWVVVLRSEKLEAWAEERLETAWSRLADRIPSLASHDPADAVTEVRTSLLAIMRRPWGLLVRTLLAQACGSLILLVALEGVGVGPELGPTEFFRVFFVTHLLGTFAPTPGGVGVVEAGMTGALVAAGVDTSQALAGVLVYRFLTYVLPIVFGAVLWLGWRAHRVGGTDDDSTGRDGDGSHVDGVVPHAPCAEDRGVRRT